VDVLFCLGVYYISNSGCLGSLSVFLVGYLVVLEVDMLKLVFSPVVGLSMRDFTSQQGHSLIT